MEIMRTGIAAARLVRRFVVLYLNGFSDESRCGNRST